MLAWFNHNFISVPDQASVSQISPKFCFFETFALRNGQVESPHFHETRLFSGLTHLQLDKNKLHLNFSDKINHWKPILKNLLEAEKLDDAIVRWIVIPNKDGSFNEWVTVRALPATPESIDLFLLKTVRDHGEWLPRPKTGPWKNSQTALDELRTLSSRVDVEGIQVDSSAHISDGTRSTIVWWDGVDWFTPSQKTQCLMSTTLEALKHSTNRPFKAVECPFPLNAKSIIVLRSTFHGGAVLARQACDTSGHLIWKADSHQESAHAVLNTLKSYRIQRSVSLL